MKYYIAENGQPAGPFDYDDLVKHGLTVNSLVWNDSLVGWTKAGEVPELDKLLTGGVTATAEPATAEPAAQEPVSPEVEAAYAPQEPAGQSAYAPQEPETAYAPQEPVAEQSPYAPQAEEPAYVAAAAPKEEPAPQAQPAQGEPQQPYAQPQYAEPQQQQPYAQPQYIQGYPQQPYGPQQAYGPLQVPAAPPVTNKTMSIIITIVSWLCCCNVVSGVLSIIAIVKASNANSAFYRGDRAGAEIEAETARKLSLYALIALLVLPVIGFIIMLFTPEASDALTSSLNDVSNM